MPVRVYWDNPEKTIIVREMSGEWTWEDYGRAIGQVNEYLNQVHYTVDIIVDCRESNSLPSGALGNLSSSNKTYPQNIGQQVIVATSYFIQLFAQMLQQYMPDKKHLFAFVNNMEDAYKLIEENKSPS